MPLDAERGRTTLIKSCQYEGIPCPAGAINRPRARIEGVVEVFQMPHFTDPSVVVRSYICYRRPPEAASNPADKL